jgi:hypothetical protein
MRKKLDLPNAIFTGLQVITTPAIALWWSGEAWFSYLPSPCNQAFYAK